MIECRTIRQLSNAERDQILEQYLSDGIAIDKARIAELEAALIGIREQPECGCCGQTDRCDDDCDAVVIGGHRTAEQKSTACVGCEGAPASGNSPCAVCGQKSALNVSALVEALRSILGWRELRSGNDFPVERIEEIARDALATYRNQGENQ